MKSIQNKALMLAIAALINTQYTQSAQDANPILEIYNKSANNITVTIWSGSSVLANKAPISAGTAWKPASGVMNINQTLDITINDNGRVYDVFIQAAGKTKYLTWNPAKDIPLYPQTGPLMGFLGKTQSGLSLKNNISANLIHKP